MIYVLAVLIALLLLDTARMRGRLGSLPELPRADERDADDFTFVTAPGVSLDAATRRAAAAFARKEKLDVVDLVPADLPAIRAMGLAQMIDPAQLRRERLAAGRTAGHAMLISRETYERAQVAPPADEVAMVKLAMRLKTYAPTSFALAIAPDERAAPDRLERRKAILAAILGPSLPVALLIQPVFLALIAWGAIAHPIAGGVAIAIWHLQALVTTLGTRLRPRDRVVATIARAPLELYLLVRTIAGTWKPPAPETDPRVDLKPIYARLIEDAPRFFEARRETCPVCASRDLRVHLRVSDLIQSKPGRFTLERCRACGHIFQNPRLSLTGLK